MRKVLLCKNDGFSLLAIGSSCIITKVQFFEVVMKSQIEEEGWLQFIKLCKQLKTEKELSEFFNLFLTIEEKNDIGARCILVKELLKGKKTQREIAANLKISIAKISRGSNAFCRCICIVIINSILTVILVQLNLKNRDI